MPPGPLCRGTRGARSVWTGPRPVDLGCPPSGPVQDGDPGGVGSDYRVPLGQGEELRAQGLGRAGYLTDGCPGSVQRGDRSRRTSDSLGPAPGHRTGGGVVFVSVPFLPEGHGGPRTLVLGGPRGSGSREVDSETKVILDSTPCSGRGGGVGPPQLPGSDRGGSSLSPERGVYPPEVTSRSDPKGASRRVSDRDPHPEP